MSASSTSSTSSTSSSPDDDSKEIKCDCGCGLFLLEGTHGFAFTEDEGQKTFREWKLRDSLWQNYLQKYNLSTWGQLQRTVLSNMLLHDGRGHFEEFVWQHLFNVLCKQDRVCLSPSTSLEWLKI